MVNSSSRSLQALAGKGPEDIAIFGASSRQAHDPWTALCIHGTLDRAASFSRLARRLEDFDVIAYDRRGYQGSRGAGASSRFGRHVDDALDIVAATHHDQPVVLIGHSFGGLIVVVYEPPLRWFDESSGEYEHPLIFDEPEREVEKFFRRMVSNASWDRMNQSARRERLDDAGGLFSDIEMTRDEIPFRIDDLNRIAIPVTFGVGDVVMNPDYGRVAKVVVDALPQGRFVVAKGAAHGIHLTHPASFADMVIETTKRSIRESTH